MDSLIITQKDGSRQIPLDAKFPENVRGEHQNRGSGTTDKPFQPGDIGAVALGLFRETSDVLSQRLHLVENLSPKVIHGWIQEQAKVIAVTLASVVLQAI